MAVCVAMIYMVTASAYSYVWPVATYGEQSRYGFTKIYMRYMNYSKELAKIYNVNHAEFRTYFLL